MNFTISVAVSPTEIVIHHSGLKCRTNLFQLNKIKPSSGDSLPAMLRIAVFTDRCRHQPTF